MKKCIFLFFAFCFFPFPFSLLLSIEVGGHLTEDTTWSLDNNPYLVTSGVYVDENVTLTILPGTIVKFNAAFFDDPESNDFRFISGNEPVAKFIKVEGRIIAEGTEQDSIVFTRTQNENYYHWGTIYITEDAQPCSFSYCHIEYAAVTVFELTLGPHGICFWNGYGIIQNNNFKDNFNSIEIRNFTKEIEISNNKFIYVEGMHPNINPANYHVFVNIGYIIADESEPFLFANNNSSSRKGLRTNAPVYAVNSIFQNINYDYCIFVNGHMPVVSTTSYIYDNAFIDFGSAGIQSSMETGDSLFIRKNNFINGDEGIYTDYGYLEVSDNYFEECDIYSGIQNTGKVYNNISNNGDFRLPGYLEVYNNTSFNGNYVGIEVSWRNISCQNNITINNNYAIGSGGTVTYINCFFLENEEINYFPISGNPTFRNCILDFELPPECIDGGGNIWVDSLQAQLIFEDIQNGDFHLIEGSLAIDAGFDTLGYYYPFDLDYNHRVWDGDGNGTAIIDIGPYEFGAPAFGGIQGITYDPTNGDFVDYVLIKINNESGEFTFSDSVGSYQYKLPAGIYDVYAERVFYDDAIEYQVEVIDGEFIQFDIPMCETVYVEEQTIPNSSLRITNLSNYPNPFNPNTSISFSIRNDSNVELSIFNIKGQKITTLFNEHLSKGKHSIIWAGCDQNGHQLSSGIYFYKIKAGDQESVKRMLLLK